MINSYAVQANAGQNMILENVSGLADRLLPLEIKDIAGAQGSNKVPRRTLDTILDFASEETATPGYNTVTMDDPLS